MSTYAYPYDPTASNPDCVVTNEKHNFSDYPNKWGVIIPKYAPFYRKDLTIRHVETNQILREGIDYYVGHHYKDASDENKMAIFGSIMIIDLSLTGTIEFVKYRTLGGRYVMDSVVINKHLNEADLTNPRNLDWLDVVDYEMMVPEVDRPDTLNEALNVDGPTIALEDLKDAIATLKANQEARFDDVIDSIVALSKRIESEQVGVHEKKNNPHELTADQVGAYDDDQTVVNALKLYGRSLNELTELVNLLGLIDTDLDLLYEKTAGLLEGALTFNDSTTTISNHNGNVTIDFKTNHLNINAKGNVTLRTTGDMIMLGAGNNYLTLHKDLDGSSGLLNSLPIIHEGNLEDYIPEPTEAESAIHTEDTTTVTILGDGLSNTPIKASTEYPEGSTTKKGLIRLSSSLYSKSTTVAASASAVYQLSQLLKDKLPVAKKLNGQTLTKDITVTKSTIGLNNVANKAPKDLNSSNAFKAEVNKKSDLNHTHSLSEFSNIPDGDGETFGLVQLSDEEGNVSNRAATPSLVNEAYQMHVDTETDLGTRMPSEPFNIMQYGGFGYLPLPVLGSYGAAGSGRSYIFGAIESDGKLVLLRNGVDFLTQGVYYWYLDFKADGTFDEPVSTTTAYAPTFLPAGVTITEIISGSDGVMIALASSGDYYLILTRNTMDASKHIGTVINDFGLLYPNNNLAVFLYKEDVHMHFHALGNGGFYSNHATVPISDVETKSRVYINEVDLTGVNIGGQTQTPDKRFFFTRDVMSNDPSDLPIVLQVDGGRWNGERTVRRGTQNNMYTVRDNVMRWQVYGSTYFTDGSTNTGHRHGFAFDLDLNTMTISPLNPEIYPLVLEPDGFAISDLVDLSYPWPGAGPLAASATFVTKGRMFATPFNGSSSVTYLYEIRSRDGLEPFDYLDPSSGTYDVVSSTVVEGAYGSVVRGGCRDVGLLNGSRLLTDQAGSQFVVSKYDTDSSFTSDGSGWGPTTDRVAIAGSVFTDLMRVPYNSTTDVNEGLVLSHTDRESYSAVDADLNMSGAYSWDDNIIEQALSDIRALGLESNDSDKTRVDDRVMLYTFGKPGDADAVSFLTYTYIATLDSNPTLKYARSFLIRCTVSYGSSTVTGINVGEAIATSPITSTVRGWTSNHDNFGGCTFGLTEDGDKVYCFNHANCNARVSSNDGRLFRLVLDKDDDSVLYVNEFNSHPASTASFHHHPTLGLFQAVLRNSGQTLAAVLYGKTTAEILEGKSLGEVIIHATNVASGWILYFTEEARFYLNGKSVTLPVQNFDLEQQSVYKNRTFYIYVVAETTDGELEGKYELRSVKTDDNDSELYIGYCRTDDTQIVEIEVNRTTRLGEFYEMFQHTNDRDAHDGVSNVTKEDFGLGKVRNLGMLHDLSRPTFKEVFDSWKRFNHWYVNDNQPYKESLLDSWIYDETLDVVQSKSDGETEHTLVGFVSPDSIGDYVFDTNIYADVRANDDDDWAGVVLAFKNGADGREKTLIAMVSGGAAVQELYRHINGDTTRYSVAVVYNYQQSDARVLHADVVLNPPRLMKNRGKTRVTAVRTDDVIEIIFYGWSEEGTYENVISRTTIDLNSDDDLAVFKGDANFGYMSQSQGWSTFENIRRPDENVGNYYASADVVRLLSERQSDTTMFVSGTVAGGELIPTPDGFTASECTAVVNFEHGGTSDKVTYAQAEVNGLAVTIRSRDISGSVVTNAPGSSASYYLIAKKKVED